MIPQSVQHPHCSRSALFWHAFMFVFIELLTNTLSSCTRTRPTSSKLTVDGQDISLYTRSPFESRLIGEVDSAHEIFLQVETTEAKKYSEDTTILSRT